MPLFWFSPNKGPAKLYGSAMREYLVAGLGNAPYPLTRHSVGHLIIDSLAARFDVPLRAASGTGCLSGDVVVPMVTSVGWKEDVRIVLAKNNKSLMNVSGPSIASVLKHSFRPPFSHPTPSRLILIHDSNMHDPLSLHPKRGGSANGHNGVKSVISALGTDAFWRLRAGIGRGGGEMAEWVMGSLSGEERRWWGASGRGVEEVWEAMEKIVKEDVGEAPVGGAASTPGKAGKPGKRTAKL